MILKESYSHLTNIYVLFLQKLEWSNKYFCVFDLADNIIETPKDKPSSEKKLNDSFKFEAKTTKEKSATIKGYWNV